jgi:hypothetical protein
MRREEPDPYLAATGFSIGDYTPDQDRAEEEELLTDGDSDDIDGDEWEIEEERAER